MTELAVAGLTKSFGGQKVLRGVDLVVPSGSLVAILGSSGSGKTTLLRLISGFERADAGEIRIGGRPVARAGLHWAPERRRVGYVAQDGALFPHLSVADNIVFGLPRRERVARHRVAELLDLVGLPAAYAARPPQALSGGEQQRVALARALAPDPALVLLDEPFSSLDAALRAETREAIAGALAATGATAVLVTHDQPEALSLGQLVAVLRDGKLVQVASPGILYRLPADPDLARFVGEAVLIAGKVRAGTVDCVLGRLDLVADVAEGEAEVLIRPEQIRLGPAQANGVRAAVTEVTFYGHDASVRLVLVPPAPPLALSARVPGHLCPLPGAEVGLAIEGGVFAYPRGEAEPPH